MQNGDQHTRTLGSAGDVLTLLAHLHRTIDDVIDAITATGDGGAGVGMGVIAELLRTSDRCKAAAVEGSLGMSDSGVIAEEGITTDTYLRMHAGRTASETSSLGHMAERLVDMPVLRSWYRDGVISDGVVRDIVWATRNLTKAQRAWVDATLASDPDRVAQLGADDLVCAVNRLADDARPDLHEARQQRAIGRRRVVAQPRLDGTGGALHADLDAEGFTAVINGLDSYHDTGGPDGDASGEGEGHEDGLFGPRGRWQDGIQQRRGQALVAMAEHRNADVCPANNTTCDGHTAADGPVAGEPANGSGAESAGAGCANTSPTRIGGQRVGWAPSQAQPSLLILTDIAALADRDHPDHATAQLLTRAAGGPVDLTSAAAERLMCQGAWRLVFTDGHEIIGVSPTQRKIPVNLKAMVIARDVHCRFPSCRASAQVCDIHHLIPRSTGGPTDLRNLALVCQQHHHAIHDGGWIGRLNADDSIAFTRRGVTRTSLPRTQRHVTPAGPPPTGRPKRRRRSRGSPSTHPAGVSGPPPRGEQPPPKPAAQPETVLPF